MLKKEILKTIRKPLILEIIFFLICTSSAALIPYMNKLLFDESSLKDVNFLLKLILVYALLIISRNLFSYLTQLYEWKIEKKYAVHFRTRVFNCSYNKRAYEYNNLSTGEYVSLIDNNIDAISEEYIEPLYNIINSIFQLLVNGFILFIFIDWRIALTIFIASILSLFIPKLTAENLSNKRNDYIKQLAKYISTVTDLFEGNFGLDKKSKENIKKYQKKKLIITENKKYVWGTYKSLLDIGNSVVMDIIAISAFVIVGFLLIKKEITIGTGVATLGYISSFIYPIRTILKSVNSIHSANYVIKDLEKFLFINNQIDDDTLNEIMEIGEIETIEFENVYLKRGDFELKNFSYIFEKGKSYALIGSSGAGKSTILEILCGSIKIDKGSIKINGIEVNNYLDIIAMNYFSVIKQKTHIFNADYSSNITNFGAYNVKDIKRGLLDEKMLNNLSNKNSNKLSGGEKQILSILKSSISNKRILLFDEVCSAIDKNNLGKVRTYIDNIDYDILIEISHHLDNDLDRYSSILKLKNGELESVVDI